MKKLATDYKRLEITIKILKWFLFTLVLVVIYIDLSKYNLCSFPFSSSCLGSFFSRVSEITKSIITLLAALLATLAADRHITHSSINIENERVDEIIQITHRYIAIANDLESKISFLKNLFKDGGYTITTFAVITESIEKRYESLFEKEAYKYLQGHTIDTINSMSGSITGILSIISYIKESPIGKSNIILPTTIQHPPLDHLLEEIKKFKNDLYDLRKSVE